MINFAVKSAAMTSDHNLQRQIGKAFESNPELSGCNISTEVVQGEAVLNGHVDKFCKISLAKKIAKEVEGTKAVLLRLTVNLDESKRRPDDEIAAEIAAKFHKNFSNAGKDVNVSVKDGFVRMEGRLSWKYQKDLAVECISCIDGIKGIENNIVVPQTAEEPVSEKDVLAAIYGDYSITSDIKVEIFGSRVILRGAVESANQKNLVTRLVRNVKGVGEVENFLSIKWLPAREV